MKKAIWLVCLILISNSILAQEIRYVLKERSTDYEKVIDTIWQVKKVITKVGESNQLIYDTVWVRMNKNKVNVKDLSGLSSDDVSTGLFAQGKGYISLLSQSSFGSELGLQGVRLGYFVAENRLIGGSGQIRFGENTQLNLSAFYRGYFGKGEKGKAWGEFNTSIVASEGSTTGGFGLGLGYTAMLTRMAGFDFGLNYQKLGKSKGEVVLNLGFVILIGR
jgi:uncharacterized protein YdcH (DUF465 family)